MKHTTIFLLGALFSLMSATQTFACSGCSKSKGGLSRPQPKVAGPSGASGMQGGRILQARTPKNEGFSDGFFNSVGRNSDDDATQPVAVPNGDGDEFKVIFR